MDNKFCFNLDKVLKKYNIIPQGIIHIGAHLGEESKLYNSYNLKNKTIWIEANPDLIDKLKKNVNNDIVINEAVSNKEELCKFYITKADGLPDNKQSSSLKEMDFHLIAHPNVSVSDIIDVNTITMSNLIKKYNIDINNYDFLNIDIQGSELDVLESFNNSLENIKSMYIEINTKSLYKDIPLVEDLDEFLNNKGFKRVETSIHKFAGWGQGFYIKN
jgi:FkbM family methyltransferase